MSDKAQWLKAINRVPRDQSRDRFELKSPQFTVAGWCIALEHQRNFRSIVLKHAERDRPPARRQRPGGCVDCPQSDRKKGWLYRCELAPHQLADFVQRDLLDRRKGYAENGAMRMAQTWKIAPGRGAEDWHVFREKGCIGLGWSALPDYRRYRNKDEVLAALEQEKRRLEQEKGRVVKGYGRGAATEIWQFVHEVKPRDIVMANQGSNKVLAIGVISSEYLAPTSKQNPLRNDTTTHRHHVRLVNWLITQPVELPGDHFFVQRALAPLDDAKVAIIEQAYRDTYSKDSTIATQLDQVFDDSPMLATPKASDVEEAPPERAKTTTYRILRDTPLARRVKKMHKSECQVCGHMILLRDGSRYAETHHIRPLGKPHDGPDIIGNVLCLCPNHHAECDLGVMKLSRSSLRHVDGHDVEKKFIEYHNRKIFGIKK